MVAGEGPDGVGAESKLEKWAMKNQKFKLAVLSVIAGAGLAFGSHQANGSVVYSYIAQQQHYSGNPGDVISVNVYLQEKLTAASDTSFLASDGGLSGFVTVASLLNSSVPGSQSKLTGATADTADFQLFSNSNFNFVTSTGDAGQLQGSADTGGVTGTVHPGAEVGNGPAGTAISNAVFLGTMKVTVGQGTTTFGLGAIDPVNGGATTTAVDVFDLDLAPEASGAPTGAYTPVGTTVTQFDITAAPEPASLGVLAMGGLLAFRRRRA
jgi:hypothetical protein